MIKWSVHQGDIAMLNVYVPNDKAIGYVNQKLIEQKEKIYLSTIIVGGFNTSLSITDRTRQKTIKDTQNIINQWVKVKFIKHFIQ